MHRPLPGVVGEASYAGVLNHYHADEAATVRGLLSEARLEAGEAARVGERARRWVGDARRYHCAAGVEMLLQEYSLSTEEGVLLMCLAEAVLRIPDAPTADRLIHDKIAAGRWDHHLSRESSMLANASFLGLWVSGEFVRLEDAPGTLRRLAARLGEPVLREAVRRAMRLLGWQFIAGRGLREAIRRTADGAERRQCYSYDMLGEGARSEDDAVRYYERYRAAIAVLREELGPGSGQDGPGSVTPGISVKLSALHPRFEPLKWDRVEAELLPRLRTLALEAADAGLAMTVDAEECERLDATVGCVDALLGDPDLAGWNGLGVAVQAYQKRARPLVEFWIERARRHGRRLSVRLVKGAYWDSEIKRAQQLGFDEYPVFTRKPATDVCFLACARRLLEARDVVYPAFGTHNAHTVAAILELAAASGEPTGGYELQRLYGMGEALHETVAGETGVLSRVYAPVGCHEELLPYLVRRLLENGANSSFMRRLTDPNVSVEEMVVDPVAALEERPQFPHPRIPLPLRLFGEERRNSQGVDLSDAQALEALQVAVGEAAPGGWGAAPVIDGVRVAREEPTPVVFPATGETLGECVEADAPAMERAVRLAAEAQPAWDARSVRQRAGFLEDFADRLELHRGELVSLCAREAGKTLADAVAEVRETVDFARYYAARARTEMEAPLPLPGPTGEANSLYLHGRGVFVCISPWNFPLAILAGQVCAALVTGNAVVVKPSEATPLTAARAVALLHDAGVPSNVLHLLPGRGGTVGEALVRDPRVSGVAFTGSEQTARRIARLLAEREGPVVPLIAETGGVNAMIVDSSALAEQVVGDVITSAFGSAGQRCSACRLLCIQEDVADRVIELLGGAMAEIRVGDPLDPSTDIGPVISREACRELEDYVEQLEYEGRLIHRCAVPGDAGAWFPPQAFEIDRVEQLQGEVFGPVLHVLRFRREDLDTLVDAINGLGYGLTFGVHSRLDSTIRRAVARIRAGNRYVNRPMVGSVVGSQPFGGEGRSGNGPHAGGPHYLHAFCLERVLTVNTAAVGGNAGLMSLDDE